MEFLFGVLIFILDVIAIVSCIRSPAPTSHKILWILVILFLPIIGMILYFMFGAKPGDRVHTEYR